MERMRTLDVVDEETKDLDFASMFLSPRVTQGLKESGSASSRHTLNDPRPRKSVFCSPS